MGNFDKGKRFGGGGGGNRSGGRSFGGDRGGNRSGGRSFGGGRDGDRKEMHKTVCSDCGNSCEVPFRPTGEKPVFCSDCFRNKGGDSRGSRDGGNRDRGFGGRDSKPRFDNKKSHQGGGSETPNYKAQFEMLNTKLDTILKTLGVEVTKEVEKPTEAPKSKKFVKLPKKEVDTVALKKALTESKKEDEKPVVKKAVAKKAPVKKVAKKAVKKPAIKKVAVKKTVTKQPTAKKKK